MEIEVGIAVYSMMITVLTFLLGFVLVFGGRVVVEMSSVVGLVEGRGVEEWVKKGKRALRLVEVVIVGMFIFVVGVVSVMVFGLSGVGEEGWEGLLGGMWLLFMLAVIGMVVSVVSDLQVSGIIAGAMAGIRGKR